ncbi:MAG TPA: zf-HC2 domain-containing protein [Streptosporangiaceae bacterium]|jgi:hypothetical protein
MTGLTDCGDIRHALGVYVLGAIDPAERAAVDNHLKDCSDCREELAGLAGLPALLGRVPLADAERLALDSIEPKDLEEPSAELLDSLLAQVAARRRARRWRVVAVAAAAAIVIAVGGGIAGGALTPNGGSSGPGGVHTEAYLARGSNPVTHVSGAVYYTPSGSGTRMQAQFMGVKPGTHCEFWLVTTSGQHLLVDTWDVVAGHEGHWYQLNSHVPPDQVKSFDITAGNGPVLVSFPAA